MTTATVLMPSSVQKQGPENRRWNERHEKRRKEQRDYPEAHGDHERHEGDGEEGGAAGLGEASQGERAWLCADRPSPPGVVAAASGCRSSSMVGMSSDTVGWMCIARRMSEYGALAYMTSRME